MLIDQLKSDIITAQKAGDSVGLSTLRFLLAEINNLGMAKYPPSGGGLPANGLPDGDVVSVLQKQVKTHHESIEAFQKGNRQDLVDKETKELAILQKYLPAQMGEEEIRKIVVEVIRQLADSGLTDFGQVMKEVMGRLKGKADGGMVSRIVKELFTDGR